MTNQKIVGWTCLALFLASIPFANWWLTNHGLWDSFGPIPGPIPSAVWVVGFAFVLRDLAQLELGRGWSWAAIAVGCFLSWWVAAPAIAFASAMAFLWSESTDALIFTPLANRGTTKMFLLGVTISGYAASVVDSALFVRLAFHSFDGWWQLTLAKVFFVLLATPVAWLVRRAVSHNALQPAGA
jgi:uncharacterized PurR-regulated membrane protein YhhQ (DUF165 family)